MKVFETPLDKVKLHVKDTGYFAEITACNYVLAHVYKDGEAILLKHKRGSTVSWESIRTKCDSYQSAMELALFSAECAVESFSRTDRIYCKGSTQNA